MFILLQICLFIFYPYDDTKLFESEHGKETRNQCISTFGAQTNVFQILNRKLQKCVPRNHTIITSSLFGARGRNLHKEGERRSKGRRGEGLGLFPTSYPSPLLLILNQARVGRIDDREFVTLTHCNKIPAPQDASFRGDTTYMLPINCAAKYTAQSSASYSLYSKE